MSQIPPTLSIEAVQQSFREVWTRIGRYFDTTQNIDMSGNRVVNAGKAIGPGDYITLFQADGRYQPKQAPSAPAPVPDVVASVALAARYGTFASRGQAAAHKFTIFQASDWNGIGWVSDGANWNYAYGVRKRTQSQLSAFAALLVTADAGLRVRVTDFEHLLEWTGSAWTNVDELGGKIEGWTAAPLTNGYQVCDGTATTFLKADGTTGSFTTPNLTGHYAKFAAAYTGTAASGGTTADTTPTNNTAATGISVAIDDHTTSTETIAGATAVLTGPITHTATVTDPSHNHTQNAHHHAPGSIDLARTELIAYYRR